MLTHLKDPVMKDIKVLGSGCSKCQITAEQIERAAKEAGVAIHVEKVQDMPTIIGYGVMSTPAVVVDGKVVHAGGVPGHEQILSWLR